MNTPLKKKKILIFIRYYLPGYKSGGPVRSISNMVRVLNYKYEFYIVCLSHDYGDKTRYKDASRKFWKNVDGANVLYLNESIVPFATFLSVIQKLEPDVVYFNSFLDPFFTFIQLAYYSRKNNKIIIAPRGELTHGALSLSKSRKKLYIYIFKKFFSRKNLTWHATTEDELRHISLNISVNPNQIYVANNIPFIDNDDCKCNFSYKEANKLNIIFLSRISPVKNLAYFLEILKDCNLNINFDIYGPIGDTSYWNLCMKKITNLPKTISVNYFGPIRHDLVRNTLSNYDLFVLPTLGENFGHIIFEALSLSIPVLISDRTPWTNLVNNGAYAAIPLNKPDQYIVFIQNLYTMSNSEFIALRAHASEVFNEYMASNNPIDYYLELFE